jgi:transposase-like protein
MTDPNKKKHGRRYTAEQKAEAMKLLAEKNPVAAVAERVGASVKQVRRWADASATPTPGNERLYSREKILELYAQGFNTRQVCDAVGCSPRFARYVKSGERAP